jgi:hypothetical protein
MGKKAAKRHLSVTSINVNVNRCALVSRQRDTIARPCVDLDYLPGGAVGVESADKSDFLVEGAATGPVDASDSES